MRRTYIIVAVVLVICVFADHGLYGDDKDDDVDWSKGGEIVKGLQVFMRLEKKTYKANEDVVLRIKFKNTGTEQFYLLGYLIPVVSWEVVDSKGSQLDIKYVRYKYPTKDGKVEHVSYRKSKKEDLVALKSGESTTKKIKNFTNSGTMELKFKPGKYKITLVFEVSDWEKNRAKKKFGLKHVWTGKVNSNTVEIEILGAKEELQIPPKVKKDVDEHIKKLGNENYFIREKAQDKLMNLLRKDKDNFISLLSYLKQQTGAAKDPEIKERLKRITKPYLELHSACRDSKLVVVVRLDSVVHTDGRGSGSKDIYMLEVKAVLNGEAGRYIYIRKSEEGEKNGVPYKHEYYKLPKSTDNRYILFIKNKERASSGASEGDIKTVPATWQNLDILRIIALGDKKANIKMDKPVTSLKDNDVKRLIKQLDENDELSRKKAAQELGELKDSKAVDPLIKALSDKNWIVRATVAWALGEINDSKAVDKLGKTLDDNEIAVRMAATKAVGKIASKEALPALRKALEREEDEDVKQMIREVISIITSGRSDTGSH